jgi:electron transport complex protein RnfG
MKGPVRLIVVLFLVCGIAAGSLAFVNAATKDRIAEFARTEKIEAMKRVLPEAEQFIETSPAKVWDGQKGGRVVGRVLAASIQGYSGPIQSFVGLDASNAVTGVSVLTQSETPGLGARITEEKFLKQFRGLGAEAMALRRDDPAGRVDAITAATISSRAVATSLRRAIEAYLKGVQP